MLRKVHSLTKEAAAVGYFEAYLKTLWCVYFFTTLYFRKALRWFTKMANSGLDKIYLISGKKGGKGKRRVRKYIESPE